MGKLLARLSQALQKNKTPLLGSAEVIGVGSIIDHRYRLEVEIGRGGMAIVYRAHDMPNNRDVAIKLIDRHTANALSLLQFQREAEIMARLKHPHIVAVYETGAVTTGASEAAPFIVMELVQGISLTDTNNLTYARIIDIGKQICEALEHVHEQGFVYRDLKPGNVFLEKCGFRYSVKLLDFGLARSCGESYLPTESSHAGTIFYLAPELIAGSPADVAADLYALGATLYEMITGRVPFSDIDEQNILAQHMEERIPPPSNSRSDVPQPLESIVLHLLEKKTIDRFASARDVFLALEQINLTQADTVGGNLPQIASTERTDEIEPVIRLLEANQLVTLLHDDEKLALAVGAKLVDQFANGVWRIGLESVSDPAAVLQTVSSVLGVPANPDHPPVSSLIGFLRQKNLLLLLSRCDHLRASCAQLVDTILRECPDVYILAVSHQPLNIPLEKCYKVISFSRRDTASGE